MIPIDKYFHFFYNVFQVKLMILPVNSVHLVITVAPQDSTCPRQCVTQDGTVPSGHHYPNQLHQREANVLLASIVPKEALPPWDVSRASIVMLT